MTSPAVVPPEFAAERIAAAGDAGRRWVEGVPELVTRFRARWRLTLTAEPPRYGAANLVFFARRDGAPGVLKICWPEHDAAAEATALRTWAGRGAVRLLDAAPDDGVLLLERADFGRTLRDLPLPAAVETVGGLIRQLAVPAPAGVPRLADIGATISGTAAARQAALDDPLPGRWVDLAVDLAGQLAATAGDRLVHADLHYGNVLAGERQPWLAIDPKAVVGDPEYSVPELMWTRVDECPDADAIRALLAGLVAAAGLDAERARGWTVVRAVDYWLWALPAGLTEDPVRCARLLDALV